MPRALTQAEYDARKKTLKPEPLPVKGVAPVEKVEDALVIEYSLMHPDTPKDFRLDGKYIVEIGDVKHELQIVRGVVRTKLREVMEKLRGSGWIFMRAVNQ